MTAAPIPRGNIAHLQKLNDASDWTDPEIVAITRDYLQIQPGRGGRAWEFAIILMALLRAGKIDPAARGLAMGAGRERLIYAIANHVAEVVATDLYTPDSRWSSVHTHDPRAFVLHDPPMPAPAERITALAMDMRHLEFPDNSFDFAWSTGAIEHIGDDEDFARHFREVHRVLKPGGVYAFTSAIHYSDETARIPHNHYFAPRHLVDLVDASPLHPEPVFDCRVGDNALNRPMFNQFEEFGLDMVNLLVKSSMFWRRGILSAANSIVLTKDDARPKSPTQVLGFDETRDHFVARAAGMSSTLWRRERLLACEIQDGRLSSPQTHFGDGEVEVSLTMPGPWPRAVVVKQREAVPPFSPTQLRLPLVFTGEPAIGRARFKSDNRYVYSFVVTGEPPAMSLARFGAKRVWPPKGVEAAEEG